MISYDLKDSNLTVDLNWDMAWPKDKENCNTSLTLFLVIIVNGGVGIAILRLTLLLWDIRQVNNYTGVVGK